MLSAIEQAAQCDYQVVVFTGGEPTLAGKDLFTAIARASSLGLSTRVVSNAHWAATDALASRMVNALLGAGLCEINFSTGDQHARFVSVDNIVRAARAARFALERDRDHDRDRTRADHHRRGARSAPGLPSDPA